MCFASLSWDPRRWNWCWKSGGCCTAKHGDVLLTLGSGKVWERWSQNGWGKPSPRSWLRLLESGCRAACHLQGGLGVSPKWWKYIGVPCRAGSLDPRVNLTTIRPKAKDDVYLTEETPEDTFWVLEGAILPNSCILTWRTGMASPISGEAGLEPSEDSAAEPSGVSRVAPSCPINIWENGSLEVASESFGRGPINGVIFLGPFASTRVPIMKDPIEVQFLICWLFSWEMSYEFPSNPINLPGGSQVHHTWGIDAGIRRCFIHLLSRAAHVCGIAGVKIWLCPLVLEVPSGYDEQFAMV